MPPGICLPTCSGTDFVFYKGLCHLYWSVLCNITLHDSYYDYIAVMLDVPKLLYIQTSHRHYTFLLSHRCTLYDDNVSSLQASAGLQKVSF